MTSRLSLRLKALRLLLSNFFKGDKKVGEKSPIFFAFFGEKRLRNLRTIYGLYSMRIGIIVRTEKKVMGQDTQQDIKNDTQKSTKQSQWKNPKATKIQELFADWEDDGLRHQELDWGKAEGEEQKK